jgi:hypothetical protein
MGVLVDEQDLVPVFQELTGDGSAVPPGLVRANAAEMRSRSLSAAITCSTSPSWITVPGPGSMASPSRATNATRIRAASSSACTFSPTQSWE